MTEENTSMSKSLKKKVYVETSVISNLTARPSHNPIDAAAQIATAAISGMDYLVTWNCSHIANAQTRPLIRKVLADEGSFTLEICTPLELTGGSDGN